VLDNPRIPLVVSDDPPPPVSDDSIVQLAKMSDDRSATLPIALVQLAPEVSDDRSVHLTLAKSEKRLITEFVEFVEFVAFAFFASHKEREKYTVQALHSSIAFKAYWR